MIRSADKNQILLNMSIRLALRNLLTNKRKGSRMRRAGPTKGGSERIEAIKWAAEVFEEHGNHAGLIQEINGHPWPNPTLLVTSRIHT